MLEGITGLSNNIATVFTFYNFLILIVGVMGGIILGALPGISPTLAVALLVPFTFHMDPSAGLILLGSVYMASVAGGAIPAILINVPGAPANVATLLDGYPMTKAGRAQEALYTCFISSFVGGIFGMLVMILLTAPLAEFALRFRSGEIFWISILGLTVVAGLGSDNLIRALMGGAFGVLLSTVGPNLTTGEFRFVFHDILTGGVHIVVALIGLFAIPQVFSEIESFGSHRTFFAANPEKGLLKKTLRATLTMYRPLGIGSVIGSIVGLIPGIGGQVSGIVAYDQTKKSSKMPEAYGTGIPEGIAAAEAANNAMVGPSLVPLLTLSIPGSPTAAVLLGGLLIHGIFPGPNLFALHGKVVYTFIASLLVAQFVMLVFGLFLSRHSNWVTKVPSLYMAAAIIVLAVFGTYSINNNFDDLTIMLSVGVIMFVGGKFGMSATPVVMGLILGGIAENSFLKGMLIADAGVGRLSYFFTGNIKIPIIIVCFFSLIFGFYGSIKGRKLKKNISKKNMFLGVLVFIFSILIYFKSCASNGLTYLFPRADILLLIFLSLIMISQEVYYFIQYNNGRVIKTFISESDFNYYPYARMFFSFILILVYISVIDFCGFYFSSFLFFLVFTFLFKNEKLLAVKKLHINFSVAAVFIFLLFALFDLLLKVSLPAGALF